MMPSTERLERVKARYVAVGVAAALIVFQKGGEATLHKGDTIDVEPRRGTLWKSD
jgi:hypothetical protein